MKFPSHKQKKKFVPFLFFLYPFFFGLELALDKVIVIFIELTFTTRCTPLSDFQGNFSNPIHRFRPEVHNFFVHESRMQHILLELIIDNPTAEIIVQL